MTSVMSSKLQAPPTSSSLALARTARRHDNALIYSACPPRDYRVPCVHIQRSRAFSEEKHRWRITHITHHMIFMRRRFEYQSSSMYQSSYTKNQERNTCHQSESS